MLFTILYLLACLWVSTAIEVDPSGYLVYCPCMGRFGNQADHILGALAFSKALNRTLIIPPWVEYRKGEPRSQQVSFDSYFQVEPLRNFHRVILMSKFMTNVAPKLWPPSRRVSFCYMERKSLDPKKTDTDCYAKDGNPFESFWDTYNISFVASEFYKPLHFGVHHSTVAENWKSHYPATDWPVLAFTGAPASFPVELENRELQRFFIWARKYQNAAKEFIRNELPRGAFVGIHLRNGIDWVRACEHVRHSQQLFASPQCLGYGNERGKIYTELCLPTPEQIIRQIKRLIKSVRQSSPRNEIRSIFVSSDSNHMIDELNIALSRMNVTAHKLPNNDPHLDLSILGLSNYFIGNCISSFTAFVKRERDVNGFPSFFWSYPKEKERHKIHEEL